MLTVFQKLDRLSVIQFLKPFYCNWEAKVINLEFYDEETRTGMNGPN